MNYVLGLTGRKRSGKDTFAARLIERHGFTRVSLADPLRELALAIDPWVRVEPDEVGLFYPGGLTFYSNAAHLRLAQIVAGMGWEKAKEIREVRRLLQVIGTDGVRNVLGDTTWIDLARRTIKALDGPVVITDVRFPNEAEMVYELCGDVARITRPSLGPGTDLHPSETALDDYHMGQDFEITNDGTVEDLHAKADALLQSDLVYWKFRI